MPYQKTMSPPEVDLSSGHFDLMFELRDVTTGRDQTKQTYISDTESRASLWHRLSHPRRPAILGFRIAVAKDNPASLALRSSGSAGR
ncbi:uncharacterized protein RSE6_05010 [Rhynchosporium secalis]|uniref:Uncharacterized protein n=1 Tax=Rhynchosporium secalis TaxID=38038 RepID=A0A1E1M6R1_RHYSE|nr:uncharacterized protein RSE6_05010 [Rhynchosporium secalis]